MYIISILLLEKGRHTGKESMCRNIANTYQDWDHIPQGSAETHFPNPLLHIICLITVIFFQYITNIPTRQKTILLLI